MMSIGTLLRQDLAATEASGGERYSCHPSVLHATTWAMCVPDGYPTSQLYAAPRRAGTHLWVDGRVRWKPPAANAVYVTRCIGEGMNDPHRTKLSTRGVLFPNR